MPETDGLRGYGTKIGYRDVGSDGEYTHIGFSRDISGPGETAETTDITNNDSPNGYREYLAGFKDGGTVSFDAIHTEDEATAHEGLVGQTKEWIHELPDDSTIEYKGIVTSQGYEIPMNDAITRSYEIKITGKPTFAAAPPSSGD